MLAPGENGETGKFLWSLSLLIRPEWYPDSYINTCFSDLKRFGTTKKFFLKHKGGEILHVKRSC